MWSVRKGVKGDLRHWKDWAAICWDAEGHGGKQVWRGTIESSVWLLVQITDRHPGRDGLKVANYQSLWFMGDMWAGEKQLVSSAQTEYKTMSLGEIYETECRKKRPLGPVGTGKMRRKPVRRETPSECDVLEAKKVGGIIIVETKIIHSWLRIKQSCIFCIWTWVSTYTYVLCMNPSPSRHQWPYENLYERWWIFPLETHIQIHTRLQITVEAPGAGEVYPRSQVHKQPLAIPKEVFLW